MVPKAYLQALFWAAQSRLQEEKENTGWWAQFLGIKSASSHSLNTCQTRVKYSELATNPPHRQPVRSSHQPRWSLWPGTNGDSKGTGRTRLEHGDPKCTDWGVYWLSPFVFPRQKEKIKPCSFGGILKLKPSPEFWMSTQTLKQNSAILKLMSTCPRWTYIMAKTEISSSWRWHEIIQSRTWKTMFKNSFLSSKHSHSSLFYKIASANRFL